MQHRFEPFFSVVESNLNLLGSIYEITAGTKTLENDQLSLHNESATSGAIVEACLVCALIVTSVLIASVLQWEGLVGKQAASPEFLRLHCWLVLRNPGYVRL